MTDKTGLRERWQERWERKLGGRGPLVGVACGLLYGLFARLTISTDFELFGDMVLAMSVAFLFLVPLVVGYLTVRVVPRPTAWQCIWLPWSAILLTVGCAVAFAWEGIICTVFALPIMLGISSIGGLAAGATLLRSRRGTTAMLLLPWLAMPIEARFDLPERLVTTVTTIEVAAPVAVVWPLVASVDTIRAAERGPALFTAIGFPAPIAATLDRPGVGGIREASFERGLVFHEVITEWEEGRRIKFTIDAGDVPREALDEHVTIGSPFFDVLTGEYRIEALPGGRTRIVLISEHRVATHFNPYARLWTDAVMESVQANILEVLKVRAERP